MSIAILFSFLYFTFFFKPKNLAMGKKLLFSFSVLLMSSYFLLCQEIVIDYFQANPNEPIFKISKILKNESNKFSFKLTSMDETANEIYLPEKEFFSTKTNHQLFTKAYVEDKDGLTNVILKSYTISKNTLLKKNEVPLIHPYVGILPLKSIDGIIITDEFELVGNEIMIFDNALSKKLTYKPYGEKNFMYSRFDFQDEYVAFVFFPIIEKDSSKLVLVNANSGEILTEKYLNFPSHSISDIKIVGEYLMFKQYAGVAYTQMLYCSDKFGNFIWSKVLENDYIFRVKIGTKSIANILNDSSSLLIDPSSGVILNKLDFNKKFNIIENEKIQILDAVPDELNENIYLSFRISDSRNSGYQKQSIVKMPSNLSDFQIILEKFLPIDETLSISLNGSRLMVQNIDNKLIYQHEK